MMLEQNRCECEQHRPYPSRDNSPRSGNQNRVDLECSRHDEQRPRPTIPLRRWQRESLNSGWQNFSANKLMQNGPKSGDIFSPIRMNDWAEQVRNNYAKSTGLLESAIFKMTRTAKLTPLQTEGADINVVVTISATSGPQYRTGDIRIEPTDGNPLTISPEVLRHLIPLQRGELFSTKRVRAGLEELARAYGREGYVDMTAEPETEVDDERKTIDLVSKIDQSSLYGTPSTNRGFQIR